jgi:hypothetical protein
LILCQAFYILFFLGVVGVVVVLVGYVVVGGGVEHS